MFTRSNWLVSLPARVQCAIRERMVVRRVERGGHIYKRGGDSSGLYQVLDGFVQLRLTGVGGNEMLVALYGPGSVFGDLSLLSRQPRHVDAVAVAAANIAQLPRADLEELSHQHPEISSLLIERLSETVVNLLEHIEDAAFLSLTQRVAKLFVSAARSYGVAKEEGVLVDVPLSQGDIGKMLGVSRQSVQREMASWKTRGCISRLDGRWLIRDLDEMGVALD